MSPFIRKQFAAYVVDATPQDYEPTYIPTMKFSGPVPHGRSDDGVWGPDAYGYTDFDDYHLSQFGA